MDKYSSDESEVEVKRRPKHTRAWVITILIVLVVGALSLVVYIHRPTIGTVTKVNATDITIQPSGHSTAKTFSITKATQMILAQSSNVHSQPFHLRDIHIGEDVMVNSLGNDQAQVIVVKPQ